VDAKLLLASNSPRRRQLLAEAGFEFTSVAPRVSERFDPHLTVRELTVWNAARKGISIARRHARRVVLSADTLVSINGKVLGKPQNRADAIRMLGYLSGRIHEVCSAVFICHFASGRSTSFCEISRVRFRRLTPAAIRRYIDKVNPLDKAGAYAAQEAAGGIIAKIRGSYSNVVGLPMEQTTAALVEFGILPNVVTPGPLEA
jgi:septum formation protein